MENFIPTREKAETPTRSRWNRKTILSLILLACAVSVGSVYAANVFLFRQSFPEHSSTSGITPNCVTLTANSGVAPPVGLIEYNCGATTAFMVTVAASYTPTFTLPSGYTNLYLNTVAGCNSSLTQLNSTIGIALQAIGYEYCARYNTVGALSSFNVTWTQ
jgi:hypothetical protein